MSSSEFIVDYYQINCSESGKGEAAIALLVEKDPSGNTKGTIKSAVLIDGGYSPSNAESIVKTLKQIEASYGVKPLLDAVSISHWDEDHYKGFINFVRMKNLWTYSTDKKFEYFKYDTKGDPLTRLYCQSWGSYRGHYYTSKGRKANYQPSDTLRAPPGVVDSTTGNVDCPFVIDIAIENNPDLIMSNAMNVYAQAQSILGINLFTGNFPNQNYDAIKDPSQLVDANNPWTKDVKTPNDWEGAPGLYIVATKAFRLGQTDPVNVARQNSQGGVFATRSTPSDGLLGVVNVPLAQISFNINIESVILLLVWKINGKDPKISLYTGGDAEWIMEEALLSFFNKSSIEVIKAGHHGSLAGTSSRFIQETKPDHVLVSAGTQFNHPVPEWILFLDAWFKDNKTAQKRIHSVCFPYNLGYVQDAAYKDGIRFFASDHSKPEIFLEQSSQPKAAKDLLYWNFFKWLEKNNPKPLQKIRRSLEAMEDWFNEPASNPQSYQAVLLSAQNAMLDAEDAYKKALAKGKVSKNNELYLEKEYCDSIYKKMSKKYAYKRFFQVACVSEVVANCWETWSDVSNSYYPVAADRAGWAKADVVMQYLQVNFSKDNAPAFKKNPEDPNINTSGKRREVRKNKKPQKKSLMAELGSGSDAEGTNPTQSQGTRDKKRNYDEMRFAPPEVSSFVMDEDAEDAIKAQEYPYDGTTPDMEDVADSDRIDERMSTNELEGFVNNKSTSNRGNSNSHSDTRFSVVQTTSFSILAPWDTSPDSQTLSLLNEDNMMNANCFLSALHDSQIQLSASVLVSADSPSWTQSLDSQDSLQDWLASWFTATPEKVLITNLQVHASGTCINSYGTTYGTLGGLQISFTIGSSNAAMVFDSTKVKEGFLIDGEGTHFDQYGFLTRSIGITLGLDPSDTASLSAIRFSISDLFHLVGYEPPFFFDSSTDLALSYQRVNIPNLPEAINGIWYYPANNNKTTLRLTAVPLTSTNRLPGINADIPGCTFSNCSVIASKQGQLVTSFDDGSGEVLEWISSIGSICFQSTLSLGSAYNSCQAWISVNDDGISLTLQWAREQSPTIESLLQWITNQCGIDATSAWSQFDDICAGFFSAFQVREVSLKADNPGNSWRLLSSFSLSLEVDLQSNWGIPAGYSVPIMLQFNYVAGASSPYIGFTGNVWAQVTDTMLAASRTDSSPRLAPILIPNASPCQWTINLASLVNFGADHEQLNSIPSVIPSTLAALSFEISTDQLAFSGIVIQAEGSDDSDDDSNSDVAPSDPVPSFLQFDQITLRAVYRYAGGVKSLNFGFDAIINLQARPPLTYSAQLEVDIQYSTGTWTLEGRVTNLNVACIYSLLPLDQRDAILNVMEEVEIVELDIQYMYNGADPTKTTLSGFGAIHLGEADLDLVFSSDNDSFVFSGTLSTDFSAGDLALGDILQGISGDLFDVLPRFIQDTRFTVPDQSKVSQPSITLECINIEGTVLLSVIAKVDDFEFSYLQLTGATFGQGVRTPKRMLRFELDALPSVDDIPLISQFKNPIDQIDFIWVNQDFTQAEIEFLNTNLFTAAKERVICKPAATPSKDPVLLNQGCHFMIIAEENNKPTAILDYNFKGTPPPSVGTPVPVFEGLSEKDETPTKTPRPINSDIGTAPWSKTMGPLTISAIGLKYNTSDEKSIIQLTLDATLELGGFRVTLNGFGFKFVMASAYQFVWGATELLIDGLGVNVNRPPLRIAGGLTKTSQGYSGGIAVKFEPYTFLAAGAYMQSSEIESMLIFLEMNGPIAELELVSLSGLTGGFGYNTGMRLPTVSEVTQHPFINTASVQSANGDIARTMQALESGSNPWFMPAQGTKWVAAGLDVVAFQAVSIQAVLVVDMAADVLIAVFGKCAAQIPQSASSAAEQFAYIEMGIAAVLDVAKGSFTCEGQLTQQSFILDRKCHLTGGFALCYWYAPSGHEGDWVFTIGGYHSAFVPPAWYPVPPRLAISWQYDDSIQITGQAYFAVTPKVCMGGGKLSLVYRSGNLGAHFDAWADFLINYQPFNFVASIGVSIGISYTTQFAWWSKTYSVDFGAELYLQGPPLAGKVHIDWTIISFDIHFGQSAPVATKLSWDSFVQMLLQNSKASGSASASSDTLHRLSITEGVMENEKDWSQSSNESLTVDHWTVNAPTFQFQFTSLFPILQINDSGNKPLYQFSGPATFMKPMHITPNQTVTSTVSISIKDNTQAQEDHLNRFKMRTITKNMPTAIWDSYDVNADPSLSSNTQALNSLLSTDNATKPQLMGIVLGPTETTECKDIIEVDIAGDWSEDVFANDPQNAPFIPGPDFVPLNLSNANGQFVPFMSSTNPVKAQADLWYQDILAYRPAFEDGKTLQERLAIFDTAGWNSGGIVPRDIVASWATFSIVNQAWMATMGPLANSLSKQAQLDLVLRPSQLDPTRPPPMQTTQNIATY